MSETKVAAVKKHKSLAKGLIAGLIGGLAATAAKTLAERIFPPQPKSGPESLLRPPSASPRKPRRPSQRRSRARPSAGASARRPARPMARSPSSIPKPPRSMGPASAWRWRRSATKARCPRLASPPNPRTRPARARQRDHLLCRLRRHHRTGAQAGAPVALTATPNHSQANSEACMDHATLRAIGWATGRRCTRSTSSASSRSSASAAGPCAASPRLPARSPCSPRRRATGRLLRRAVGGSHRLYRHAGRGSRVARRGLARRLMAEVESRLHSAGAGDAAACLHRERGSHPLLRIDRLRAVGVAKNFYAQNLHALLYRKQLPLRKCERRKVLIGTGFRPSTIAQL